MRVIVLATDAETRNYYITLAVLDAVRRHPRVVAAFLATHGDAMAVAVRERCSLLIAVGGARHESALLERLCAAVPVSVLWVSEDPYEVSDNVRLSRCFTRVLTNDPGSVADYAGRAQALSFAASAAFHQFPVPDDDSAYRYDLCFVGTAWPNRVASLDRILGALGPSLSCRIALPGNQHLPRPVLSSTDQDTGWRCSNSEFARLSNLSRVTLALGRDFTTSPSGRASASGPPPRLFEVALAGGFQVLLGSAYGAFSADEGVVACRDEDEVVAEVRSALSDPLKRMRRARAAQQRALATHLYDHRIADILDLCDTTPVAPVVVPDRTAHVLIVTHNMRGMLPGGGVETYQEGLPRMHGGHRFSFLVPVSSNTGHAFRLFRPDGTRLDLPLPAVHTHALSDERAETAFRRILVDEAVDIVHFQHLIGFPLSLPLVADWCGVPTVWTLHDHYLACKRFNLIDYSGRFCDVGGRSGTNCDVCLNATDGLPSGSQGRRRAFLRNVVSRIDAFVASTAFSRDYLRMLYPSIELGRFRIVEMATDSTASRPPDRSGRSPERLSVVIPGNFTEGKGGHQLVRLMNLMRDDHLDFAILGRVHPDFAEILRVLAIPNLRVIGDYDPSNAVSLMSAFDVSLHLSVWPETYMITLTEAWIAGVVPIVSALGAPGERVSHEIDGFIVAPLDIGAVADLLRRLMADPSSLEDMRAAIAVRPTPTLEAHLAALRSCYESLLEARPVAHVLPGSRQKHDVSAGFDVYGFRTNSTFWDRADNVWDPVPDRRADASLDAWFDGIPDRWAALPLHVVDGREPVGAALVLDSIGCDGVEHTGPIVKVSRELSVRGWAFAGARGPLEATFLRITSVEGAVRVVRLPGRPRPDVAVSVEDPLAAHCGFDLAVLVDRIAVGEHDVDIIQAYFDSLVVLVNVLSLRVRADRTPIPGQDNDHPVLPDRAATFRGRPARPATARVRNGAAS